MPDQAALYLRSSKDLNDVSPDAQRRALHQLARDRGLVVVDEFLDAVESGKDEHRPAFQRLVQALRQPDRAWNHVLLLDTSRLARKQLIALIFEREAARHGVRIVYRNIPDADPATTMILKSVLQAFDEWHSMISRQKGLAGMAENVRQGWRAGGRAPRGYRLEYVPTGAVREGEPVTKSRLVIDEELAGEVTAYLQLRAAGVPRGAAVRRLRLRWPPSSTHSMDWQALTYAGHTVWGMHSEREGGAAAKGEKRRPRDQWLIQRQTHEALITDDQAEAILAELERATLGRRVRETPLLLSGLVKAPDGRGWHSDGSGCYRLAKGRKIAARRLESAVLGQIGRDLAAEAAVAAIRAAAGQSDGQAASPQRIAGMQRRIANLSGQIDRTVDLAGKLEDPAPVLRRVAGLEATRETLIRELEAARAAAELEQASAALTDDDIRAAIRVVFEDLQEHETPDQLRRAIAEAVERIDLDPETLDCRVHYMLATGVSVASRRGFEPLLPP